MEERAVAYMYNRANQLVVAIVATTSSSSYDYLRDVIVFRIKALATDYDLCRSCSNPILSTFRPLPAFIASMVGAVVFS